MSLTVIFESLACLLSLVAAILMIDQYLVRPRPYKLLWSLGLLCYGLAAGAQSAAALVGWNVLEFKIWYFCGGLLTAIYLGLGSLALLAQRQRLWWIVPVTLAGLLSLYGLYRIVSLAVDPVSAAHLAALARSQQPPVIGGPVTIPPDLLALAPILSIPGALLLFGGAMWSAWSFYRRHAPSYRLISMVLLALGSVFPSFLTGFARLGYSGGAALGEFLGAVCILAGLLISLEVFTVFRIPFTQIVLRQRRAVSESVSA